MMGRLRTSKRRSRRASLGYTVIEVMMALAVLSIGATGVIAMQKAALIGNVRARNLATASAIASTWIERLRVDALRWRVTSTGQSTIGQTTWLGVVGDDYPNQINPEDTWSRPLDDQAQDISARADVLGRDTFTDADVGYCTHIKLTQITDNTIRAEVRVFWLRYGEGAGATQTGSLGIGLCDSNPAYPAQVSTPAALLRYHFVYLATAILRSD